MPCYYEETPQEIAAREAEKGKELAETIKELKRRDAMLCGVLNAIGVVNHRYPDLWNHVYHSYDGNEAGVSYNEVLMWYTKHLHADHERKAIEERAREDAVKKYEARKKAVEIIGSMEPELVSALEELFDERGKNE